MKKYSIFSLTKAIVNIHFFLSVISIIAILFFSFFKEEEIPQENGQLLNLKGNYISVRSNWDVKKDYFYKNNDKTSPDYYLEKNQETGILHLKTNNSIAILIILQNLLTFGIYILIAYFLKEIFNSSNQTKIFTYKNAIRIRNIGLALMLGAVLNILHGYFLTDYVRDIIISFGKMKFQTTFLIFGFPNSFLIGLLIVTLSQIFKRGVELQEENELTV